jgi:hypothetical protein
MGAYEEMELREETRGNEEEIELQSTVNGRSEKRVNDQLLQFWPEISLLGLGKRLAYLSLRRMRYSTEGNVQAS